MIEEFISQYVFPLLEAGDPNWDKPHALATVHHIRQIITLNPQYQLDPEVMLLTAYLHDIGYSKFYKKGQALSRDEYLEAKKLHMEVGRRLTEELLVHINITNSQKERILHLVEVHDRLELLHTKEELILMEADTLGGLDVNFVKPSFSAAENTKHMQQVVEKRLPLFITEYGKDQFHKLMKLREDYYAKRS